MKKLLLALSLSVPIMSIAQNGQLQNGGFENWTSTPVYENPQQWNSSNYEQGIPFAGTSKVTPGFAGTYAAKIESEIFPSGDTLVNYIYLGHVGQSGPDGGIPYTMPFNKVSFRYQSNLPLNDSAGLVLVQWEGGIPFYTMKLIGGSTSSWTSVVVPVTSPTQDSIFIGFTSGNPFNDIFTTNGSFLMVDSVTLINTMGPPPIPLPNPSFETWTSVSVVEPDNWNTINGLTVGMGIITVSKTTDKNSGTYAAKLEGYVFGQDTIPGIINLGSININSGSPFAPVPYTAEPATFSGAYKYGPSGTDAAAIMIEFYAAGVSVAAHAETISGSSSTYQTFSAPLTFASTPDSVVLLIMSGNNPGSLLKVDDLSLSGGNVGILDLGKLISVNAYPNPADEQLLIEIELANNENVQIIVSDINGREVIRKNRNDLGAGSSSVVLDVSNLDSGMYFYSVQTSTSSYSDKFIVK